MDFVVFGFNDWHNWEAEGFRTRSAAIVSRLAEHPDVGKILVISTPRSVWMNIIRRMRGLGEPVPARSMLRGSVLTQVAERVWVLDHSRLLPREDGHPVLHVVNGTLHDRQLRACIRRSVRELGMRSPVLWVANPLMAKHIGTLGECLSVFDAIDDWASHPQKRRMRGTILNGYEKVAKRADVIFCVSRQLARRLGEGRAGTRWMPNGVDAARFSKNGSIPSDISTLPRPIVGYVGVLQERIDVDAVGALARSMSRASIVLVGPIVSPGHFSALNELPNVHLLGDRPHREIPSYLHSFDVCILPHTDSALTQSMNPLKVYEYLAAGKPIVASGLADFEAADGLIREAVSTEDFVRGVLELAERDDGLSEARRRFAEHHSWDAVVERMLAAIRADIACRQGGPVG